MIQKDWDFSNESTLDDTNKLELRLLNREIKTIKEKTSDKKLSKMLNLLE